jgi:hypothetical protein
MVCGLAGCSPIPYNHTQPTVERGRAAGGRAITGNSKDSNMQLALKPPPMQIMNSTELFKLSDYS